MENPIYKETVTTPAGFGQAHVATSIQNGLLWTCLVRTSECRNVKADRNSAVAMHRYKENKHYLLAMSLAKYAGEIYPYAVVTEDPEVQQIYCDTRDAMRQAYERFASEYKRGQLSYTAIKPIFRQMVEEAA